MAEYKIVFKKSAVKELKRLPERDLKSVIACIDELKENPRPKGCEKLSGQERYRVRQGDYRIIYSIGDDLQCVFIFKIGHRREVYR